MCCGVASIELLLAVGWTTAAVLLHRRLLRALARSQRSRAPLALMHLDIEQREEALLSDVGVRLRACVRVTDTVARIGAGHFVVLLEVLTAGSALAAVQGTRSTL